MLRIKNFEDRLHSPEIKGMSFRAWYVVGAITEWDGSYYSISLQKNGLADFDWVQVQLDRNVDMEFPYNKDSDDVYKLKFIHKKGHVIYEHWLSKKWLKKTDAALFLERVVDIIENFVINHPNNH